MKNGRLISVFQWFAAAWAACYIAALPSTGALAQPKASAPNAQLAPGKYARTFVSAHDGSAQPYRLYIPSAMNKEKADAQTNSKAAHVNSAQALPLIVVLHGKGVNQNAWFDYTPICQKAEARGWIAAAPHGRGNYFYRGPGEQDVLDMIAEVRRLCPVDATRIYLAGHSMGGWGTWWLGLRHPDLFASIAPMAGFAQQELLPNAQHLAPFIIHDETDDIVEVANSRTPARELAKLGVSFQYREESGYGHRSKMIGDNLDRIMDWFEAHSRAERPPRVRVASRTPAAGRSYWLEILETAQYPKIAYAESRMESPGRIMLKANNVKRMAIDLSQAPPTSSPLTLVINGCALEAPARVSRFALECETSYNIKTSASAAQNPANAQAEKSGNPPQSAESWRIQANPNALRAWKSEILATFPDDPATTPISARMASIAGELLREATGADVVLALDDMFARPPAETRGDDILDAYLYPEDRLARFRIKGSIIRRALDSDSPYRKKWWGGFIAVGEWRPGDQEYSVAAPLLIAKSLGVPYDIEPEAIGEILYRSLKKRGSFPPVK